MHEQQLLNIKIKLEVLITEREGMIAGNASRASRDEAPAYSDSDFFELQHRINVLADLCKPGWNL